MDEGSKRRRKEREGGMGERYMRWERERGKGSEVREDGGRRRRKRADSKRECERRKGSIGWKIRQKSHSRK